MRTTLSTTTILSAAIAWALTALPARAVLITHNNSPVLVDGFESNVTSTPDLDPDPAKWSVEETDQDHVQVMSIVENPALNPPSAYEGNNSLKVYRNGSSNAFGSLGGEKSTGQLHAEFAVYIPGSQPNGGTVPYSANFALSGGTADNGFAFRRVWISAFRDASDPNDGPVLSGNIKYYNGAWTNTGLTWTANQWQIWEIDLTLDPGNPDSFTVSLNGSTSALLLVQAGQEGTVDTFVARGTDDGSFFHLDAIPIPEPSGATLLGIGLIGAAGATRRQRSQRRA